VCGQISPAFIPISAVHAFIRQSASLMSLEQFRGFDKELIEKLGRDQIGRRRWNKLSEEEKIQETYEIISDQSEYEEGLKESNFDKFMAVLEHFVGGEQVQRELIEKQIMTSMRALRERWPGGIANHLYSVYKKRKALDGSAESSGTNMFGVPHPDPEVVFWESYKACEDSAFQQFTGPEDIHVLAEAMDELLCYHKVSKQAGRDDDGESTVTTMKALIRRLIGVLMEKDATKMVLSSTQVASADPSESTSWSSLSALDWTMIWRSILLLSYDKYFCQVFGKEKILLESLAQSANAAWVDSEPLSDKCLGCSQSLTALSAGKQCPSCCIVYTVGKREDHCCIRCRGGVLNGRCNNCSWTFRILTTSKASVMPFYYNGKPVPADPDPLYKANVHIDVPESLSDPKHFGHLMWKFCEFMASREGTK
jgi:hypothetical protein